MISATGSRGTAVFSDCMKYRFELRRSLFVPSLFHKAKDLVVNFLMLNPSKADQDQNDNTISRCIQFALDWGCNRLIITNLFALRSTDPGMLYETDDPIGAENDTFIDAVAAEADLVVCAWGNDGRLNGRGSSVLQRLMSKRSVHALVFTAPIITKKKKLPGEPGHPLYLPASLTPFLITPVHLLKDVA